MEININYRGKKCKYCYTMNIWKSAGEEMFFDYTPITVEADDINNVQDAINDTKNALNNEITRATNAEKTLTTNLNAEITRAKKAENTLQTNINTTIRADTKEKRKANFHLFKL